MYLNNRTLLVLFSKYQEETVMALQEVGKMSLKNSGGFIARIQFSYMDGNGEKHLSNKGNDINLGATKLLTQGRPCK